MNVDMILQGKGGVGKSFISVLLAQFYKHNDKQLVCFDTDPVNATFAGYNSLNVQRLELMNGDDINQRKFDDLMGRILEGDEDEYMVVDNGASSFVPMCSYLASNNALNLLKAEGHTVRLHSVLTGGQALEDTFAGLMALITAFPDTTIVVWFNEFFGPITVKGVPLEDTQDYANLADHISHQVLLPTVKAETFGYDLEQMLRERKTFAEAIKDPAFTVMARQRLKTMNGAMFDAMQVAQL